MTFDQARAQWDSAAPGWARWEPRISSWLRSVTELMLMSAGLARGMSVLDVACGAGDQTFAAARIVGEDGHVLATDISPKMIEMVRESARKQNLPQVEAEVVAAAKLSELGTRFDAAICRLGLMLIPDPGMIVRTVNNMLRPGGRFAAAVIGSPDHNSFLSEPLTILRTFAKKPPPPRGAPGIFALSDPALLEQLFTSGGFIDVTIETIEASLCLPSAADAVELMQQAFGVYRTTIADQDEQTQQSAWRAVSDTLIKYEAADGFSMPAQFHIVSGGLATAKVN